MSNVVRFPRPRERAPARLRAGICPLAMMALGPALMFAFWMKVLDDR